MKLQAAIEYLLVAALAVGIILPIFYYSLIYSVESVDFSRAQNSVNSIAKSADEVYALGLGSSKKILVSFPANIETANVSGKRILLRIKSSAGVNDVITFTKADVTGILPTQSGFYNIILNMTESGVRISYE